MLAAVIPAPPPLRHIRVEESRHTRACRGYDEVEGGSDGWVVGFNDGAGRVEIPATSAGMTGGEGAGMTEWGASMTVEREGVAVGAA